MMTHIDATVSTNPVQVEPVSGRRVMDTLPVCSVRRISYSTFTIVDVEQSGRVRIVEHGNNSCLLLRGCRSIDVSRQVITVEKWQDREVLFAELDDHSAKDDITTAVVYIRQPRRLLLITGPPFARERDSELAELVRSYPGRKVICGGTTANIIARELDRKVVVSLDDDNDPEIPPFATMQGVNLITEGTLTLSRVADMLERYDGADNTPPHAATMLRDELLDSNQIEFVVGTRINEAHQDPNIPIELETRRNLVARIQRVLESKHLKETQRRYL